MSESHAHDLPSSHHARPSTRRGQRVRRDAIWSGSEECLLPVDDVLLINDDDYDISLGDLMPILGHEQQDTPASADFITDYYFFSYDLLSEYGSEEEEEPEYSDDEEEGYDADDEGDLGLEPGTCSPGEYDDCLFGPAHDDDSDDDSYQYSDVEYFYPSHAHRYYYNGDEEDSASVLFDHDDEGSVWSGGSSRFGRLPW